MTGCLTHDADTVHLEEFLDYVTPVIHNVPTDLAMNYVRRAAIAFCERTPVLRDALTLDLQRDVWDYVLEWGNPQLLVRGVSQCFVNGSEYLALPTRPIRLDTARRGYWFAAPRELLLSPAPGDAEGGLVVEVLAKPTPGAETLPRVLLEQYAEAIADGALSRLLLMKTADWYDVQAAGIHLKRFNGAMSLHRQDLIRGGGNGPTYARGGRWV